MASQPGLPPRALLWTHFCGIDETHTRALVSVHIHPHPHRIAGAHDGDQRRRVSLVVELERSDAAREIREAVNRVAIDVE